MKELSMILCAFVVAACGGGGSSPLGGGSVFPAPVPGDSPGGIWVGTDSAGDDVLALVGEGGGFVMIGNSFNRGQGFIGVSAGGNDINGSFNVIPEYGLTLPDGTTGADCALSGTVTERQAMTLSVDCTTTANTQHRTAITLSYDSLYELDSGAVVVAGNYDDGSGNVLSISAVGELFEQDAATGCVVNGEIQSFDGAVNDYNISFDIANCLGQDAIFNGSSFGGSAFLDNTINPEQLIVFVVGDVASVQASIVGFYERL